MRVRDRSPSPALLCTHWEKSGQMAFISLKLQFPFLHIGRDPPPFWDCGRAYVPLRSCVRKLASGRWI